MQSPTTILEPEPVFVESRGGSRVLTAANLDRAARARGLLYPPHVLEQVVAAVDTGRHVVLTGPPGTGKTTLAHLTAELAQHDLLCSGFLPTTATSEWTTDDTIGTMIDTAAGRVFCPGLFVEAIESGRWLVIDEMNRSDFDKAFGQLFTVLSGQPVVLPHSRNGGHAPISIVPAGAEPPPGTDPVQVPVNWRIIGTINDFDKDLLYDMSFALMRRFTFVEVASPDDDDFGSLLDGPGGVVTALMPLRELRDLGPAIYIDAAQYARRRGQDGVTRSRLLYEVLYAYFVPQFDGAGGAGPAELYDVVAHLLDDDDRQSLRRSLMSITGVAVGP